MENEQAKHWQRYEARTLKRAAMQSPEAKDRAEQSLSFFRDLGHSGRPLDHDVAELGRVVAGQGREVGDKLQAAWRKKDERRVEMAKRALARPRDDGPSR